MKTYLEQRNEFKSLRILGIDEAGRGNLAGEMVVAGCVLKTSELSNDLILQINDSKKLSKKQRESLFEEIKLHSIYTYVVIDVKTINELGPKKASIYGMQQVIKKLEQACDYIFVDFEKITNTNKPVWSISHGDALSINIAAASIIAKVTKDKLMEEFVKNHKQYDVYDFLNNAGYDTKKHLNALNKYGKILNYHRLNYKPVLQTKKINKD